MITKSTRDLGELKAGLQRWLRTKFGDASITAFDAPVSNGMSSLTVLFDATWTREDGVQSAEHLVARFAPESTAVPVFPRYDLDGQFEIIRRVQAADPAIPLPRLWWSEPDPVHVGAPFFVMGRIEGQVPPDNMPYNLGSWVTEASEVDRARLQTGTVQVLARIHALPTAPFGLLGEGGLRHHVEGQRAYYEWTIAEDGGTRVPLIERCFEWLEAHWPEDEGPTVLCWGDARPGNVMYRDFTPVAVFDWEMAALAPREVDLAWFIFLHRFFEDIAITYTLPGLPTFCRRDDVVAAYVEASGYEPRDLDFYLMYAALRHGIVMSQTQRRSIHFGEAERPASPDELILHRPALESLLAGTYTWP